MARVEITRELLDKYKMHPRILEVRLILLFDLFEKEFGYANVMSIFEGICKGFKRNKDLLDTVLAKRFDIKRKSKTNRAKWKQEVMFMGMCYGETPYKIAKNYLFLDPSNLYRTEFSQKYNPNEFLTDEWLRQLDDEAKVTGSSIYRNEVSGFLEIMEALTNVLLRWRSDKSTTNK
jgi:hypothetical protein